MTGLEWLLAVAGLTVTALVIAGMILLTPKGTVGVGEDSDDAMRADLSAAPAPDRPPRVRTGS